MIEQLAVFPPAIAVMVVFPSESADTRPDSETEATLGLVDVQETPSYEALEGDTFAFRDKVSPISISALGWLRAIEDTSTSFPAQATNSNNEANTKI